MKKLKKITCALLVLGFVMLSGMLSACNIFKEDETPSNNEILFLDGTSIVMSLDEAEELLSQAKTGAGGQSLLSTNLTSSQYSKADLLLIINQIKENMINSTKLSFYYTYDAEEDKGNWDKGIVCNDLQYSYSVEGNNVYEEWIVKESGNQQGEYTQYVIETDDGLTTYTKFIISEETVNIERFCLYKFLFMTPDIEFDETCIEDGYVYGNNLYISLHIDEMDGETDFNERFIVEDGRIIRDKLSFIEIEDNSESYFGVTQNYAWDEDVDETLLNRANNIPQNVEWQQY